MITFYERANRPRFDENTLYIIDELKEMLHGLVEWQTFCDRLGLRKNRVFKDAVWDCEIIEVARKADRSLMLARLMSVIDSHLNRGRKSAKPGLRLLSVRDFRDGD